MRHFLFTVLQTKTGAHQLEIVHHQQVQTVPGLQLPGLRAQVGRGQGGRVADEQPPRVQAFQCSDESLPLAFGQQTLGQQVGIQPGGGREQPGRQFLASHLQRKEAHALPTFRRRQRHGLHPGGFPLTRTPGYQVQAARPQAILKQNVYVRQAGGDAPGDDRLAIPRLLGTCQRQVIQIRGDLGY